MHKTHNECSLENKLGRHFLQKAIDSERNDPSNIFKMGFYVFVAYGFYVVDKDTIIVDIFENAFKKLSLRDKARLEHETRYFAQQITSHIRVNYSEDARKNLASLIKNEGMDSFYSVVLRYSKIIKSAPVVY